MRANGHTQEEAAILENAHTGKRQERGTKKTQHPQLFDLDRLDSPGRGSRTTSPSCRPSPRTPWPSTRPWGWRRSSPPGTASSRPARASRGSRCTAVTGRARCSRCARVRVCCVVCVCEEQDEQDESVVAVLQLFAVKQGLHTKLRENDSIDTTASALFYFNRRERPYMSYRCLVLSCLVLMKKLKRDTATIDNSGLVVAICAGIKSSKTGELCS